MASLFVGLAVGAVGVLFAYKNAQNSSRRAEIERQAYLDSLPCQLNAIARIVAVDESSVGASVSSWRFATTGWEGLSILDVRLVPRFFGTLITNEQYGMPRHST